MNVIDLVEAAAMKNPDMAYCRGFYNAANRIGIPNPYEAGTENFRQFCRGFREGREAVGF